MTEPGMTALIRSGGSRFGLRERVAINLDAAVAQISAPGEQFLWEISLPLVQQAQQAPGVPPQLQMNTWLGLIHPSPIIGEGSIMSASRADLRTLAIDTDATLNVIRQLATNLRQAMAEKVRIQ